METTKSVGTSFPNISAETNAHFTRRDNVHNAKMKARGYKAEGEISGLKGRIADLRGKYQAVGTLLGGGADTYKYGQEVEVFS